MPMRIFALETIPYRGEIILLAITLGIRFLYQGYIFLDQHYFRRTVWNQWEGGGAGLQSVLVMEMCIAMFSMAGIAGTIILVF